MAARRRRDGPRYDPTHKTPKLTVPFSFVPSSRRVVPSADVDFIPGAPWWLALSEHSQAALETLFDNEEVGCCLIERIGAFKETGKEGALYVLNIQVQDSDWDTDLCLSEIGIYLQEMLPEE